MTLLYGWLDRSSHSSHPPFMTSAVNSEQCPSHCCGEPLVSARQKGGIRHDIVMSFAVNLLSLCWKTEA